MEWLTAANHNIYDHVKAFNELPYIDWRQTANYNIGDLVYIFCKTIWSHPIFSGGSRN